MKSTDFLDRNALKHPNFTHKCSPDISLDRDRFESFFDLRFFVLEPLMENSEISFKTLVSNNNDLYIPRFEP